jgi:hypothetical protein
VGKFTALITGKNGDRHKDTVNVEAPNRDLARSAVKNSLLPGERIVYIGPGDQGTKIQPPRG